MAQKFGAGDYTGMRKFVANAGWLSAVFAAVMTTIVGLLCMNILQWMNTPEDIIQGAYDYIFVIFLGIPVTYLSLIHIYGVGCLIVGATRLGELYRADAAEDVVVDFLGCVEHFLIVGRLSRYLSLIHIYFHTNTTA